MLRNMFFLVIAAIITILLFSSMFAGIAGSGEVAKEAKQAKEAAMTSPEPAEL